VKRGEERISLAKAANILVVSAYTFSENALRLPAIDGPAVTGEFMPREGQPSGSLSSRATIVNVGFLTTMRKP
jgi:hypothetical protein